MQNLLQVRLADYRKNKTIIVPCSIGTLGVVGFRVEGFRVSGL